MKRKKRRKWEVFCFPANDHNLGYPLINLGKGNYRPYHRYLVEKFLGRDLDCNEVVHHRDLNRRNNKITNFILFKNRLGHGRLHGALRRRDFKPTDIPSNLKQIRKKEAKRNA